MPPPSGYEPAPLADQVPVPPLRPTSVSVIAIIGIVWASLGLICAPLSIVPYFVASMGAQNPTIKMVQDSKLLFGWTIVFTALSFALAVMLMASSIGSLRLTRWARTGMIGWAIGATVLTLLNTVVQVVFVLPPLLAKMSNGNPADQGAAIGGVVGVVFGLIVGFALPIVVVIFFRKQHVVDAFTQASASRI